MKKQFKMIGKALAVGFAMALFFMMIVIYFGYAHAYAIGGNSHEVKIFGLTIYRLIAEADQGKYIGISDGINMGIISACFMAGAVVAAELIHQYRKHNRG